MLETSGGTFFLRGFFGVEIHEEEAFARGAPSEFIANSSRSDCQLEGGRCIVSTPLHITTVGLKRDYGVRWRSSKQVMYHPSKPWLAGAAAGGGRCESRQRRRGRVQGRGPLVEEGQGMRSRVALGSFRIAVGVPTVGPPWGQGPSPLQQPQRQHARVGEAGRG